MIIGIYIVTVVGLLYAAGIFYVLGAIGLIRFPDVYARSHSATKAPTVTQMFIALAVTLIYPEWAVMNSIIMISYLILDPTGTHVLVRSAYHSNIKMKKVDAHDDLKHTVSTQQVA